MITIKPKLSVKEREIKEEFIHSSGAGGQNINKVATAVQLRLDVAGSPSLSPLIKERLIKVAGKRMSGQGELIITARKYRTRERNRQDARSRLNSLIARASEEPKPRKKTKPTKASQKKRLESKRHQGEKKRLRIPVNSRE